MEERNQQVEAQAALAAVQRHQDRTRRAARLPWWVYPVIFVLVAGATAANDFTDLQGTKLIALVLVVVLVVVLVASFAGRSSLLGRLRGVERRQPVGPRAFGAMVIVGGLVFWLMSAVGRGLTDGLAGAVGLADYPNTVAGIVFGAVVTAVFGLYQVVITALERRTVQ